MSYDLDLYFEPAILRARILEYFATRKRFKVENDKGRLRASGNGRLFLYETQVEQEHFAAKDSRLREIRDQLWPAELFRH
jgi:hypothetical protein